MKKPIFNRDVINVVSPNKSPKFSLPTIKPLKLQETFCCEKLKNNLVLNYLFLEHNKALGFPRALLCLSLL